MKNKTIIGRLNNSEPAALARIGQGYSPSRRQIIVRQNWRGMLNFVPKFFKKKFRQNMAQKGIALLLTVIIISIVLLIATLIANIVITQLKLAGDINDSTTAIYAADSGVEWQLYQIRNGVSVPAPAMSNGATVSVTVVGASPNFTIKSLGSFRNVSRKFQVSF